MAWAPDYVTDEELRDYVDVDDLDDDDVIALAISTSSRSLDDHTNRQFGLIDAPAERLYTAWPDYSRGVWVVTIDDVQTATGLVVEVDGTTVTAAGYRLEPVNAPADGKPWTRLVFLDAAEAKPCGVDAEVSVVARWGWTATPEPVKQATRLQAIRLLKRRHAPFGVAGSPELGSELRILAKLDPDVAVALRGYCRPRAVG
jgi:hypothetical protein